MEFRRKNLKRSCVWGTRQKTSGTWEKAQSKIYVFYFMFPNVFFD